MDARLLLKLGLSPRYAPYDAVVRLEKGLPALPDGVLAAVHRRDHYGCRFCGFYSEKYQKAIVLEGGYRELSRIATACIFCEQTACVDTVPLLRSGVLVWMPELTQADLNDLAKAIYVCRISQGEPAVKARALLDAIMKRRRAATENFGSDDPAKLADQLRHGGDRSSPTVADAVARGLRLCPLDRRIIQEHNIEFNQFPQILAYWRSKKGPLSTESAAQILASYSAKLGFAA